MSKHRSLLVVVLFVMAVGVLGFYAATSTHADPQQSAIATQIIARERAAVEAWKRKDKAFWADYLSDDGTAFFPDNPYLVNEPKVNFLPKFEEYAEQYKYLDFQMFNPHVQVYGDTAVLTYNQSAMLSFGGRVINITGKVTSVYVKQGNTWRVVHQHESMNPGAQ